MIEDDIEKELFQGSLYLTSKYLCGFEEVNHFTHGDMIKALESNEDRIMIVMPRGHFKSSVGSVAYPVWKLISNPDLRIAIDSETYVNSKNFVKQIQLILESDKFISLFGDLRSKKDWATGTFTLSNRSKILKESSVTAMSVNTVKVGQHYDIIIGDDLNSEKNSHSRELCEKVIDHYKRLVSILDPGGKLILVGTRYSELDVIGHVLREELNNHDPIVSTNR